MDFSLNDQQRQIKKMTEDLAREKFAPRVRELEAKDAFPREHLDHLARQGLMGLLLPPPFGGAGADIYSFLLAVEAIGRVCPATAFLYNTHLAASLPILAMGSEQQKSRYLKLLASGERTCGIAGTESGGGTNPFAITTFASREGDGYVLDGSKVYISGAGELDLYLVLARTDQQPGPASLSVFLVEKGTSGLSVGKMEDKLGLRSLPTGELIFESCRVGTDALLGPVGAGLRVLGIAAGLAALGGGAIALGLAQAAVDETKKYLLERTILGQKLGEIGMVQLRFADMLTEVNAVRALLYRAAYDRETSPPGLIPSIFQAKVYAAEKALRIIDDAIQLHGAYGYSREFPLEKYYRDARALTIHFGASDVLRATMSQLVLGLLPG